MSSPFIAKKLFVGALLALTACLALPALAAADAPDIDTAVGTLDRTTNTVSIHGEWSWNTHHSDCNTNRSGVGVAVDWGDPRGGGHHVTTLGTDPIDVGFFADNVVHPAQKNVFGIITDITDPATQYAQWRGGCGTFNAPGNLGIPSGHYGLDLPLSHQYPADFKGPFRICVISYDVHGKDSNTPPNGGAPSGPKEVTAGDSNRNGDNSSEKNASTRGGNRCVEVKLPNHPSLSTNAGPAVTAGNPIRDTAALDGASADHTGSVTFYLFGPGDDHCNGKTAGSNAVDLSKALFTSGPQPATGVTSFTSDPYTNTATTGPGTYHWIATYTGDSKNDPVTELDNVCGAPHEDVIVGANPSIRIVKVARANSILAGQDAVFDLEVTNDGDQPLTNITIDDAKCNAGAGTGTLSAPDKSGGIDLTRRNDATLEPFSSSSEKWTYVCTAKTTTATASPFENQATATGTPPSGPPVNDTDNDSVLLRHPSITIVKSGQSTVQAGTTINYTLTVFTTGDQKLHNVVVTDPVCDPGSVSAPTFSKGNNDAFLELGEIWTYTCHKATTAADAGTTIHNIGFVTGVDDDGDQVNDQSPFDTSVTAVPGCVSNCGGGGSTPNPQIRVTKTGPGGALAGSNVTFTLTVTNPGDQPLSDVVVSDVRCNVTAPTLVTNNNDGSPTILNPGDVWVYTCTSSTAVTDTTLHNDVTTTGKPPSGPPVNSTASADVPLTAPAQEVAPLLPGVARLRGPTGCIAARTHVLSVTGSRIARVSFYVDGRYVGTRTKPNRGSRYTLTIRGAKLRRGSHLVTARVTYQADTNPRTKTLTLAFARCARAVTPKFTG